MRLHYFSPFHPRLSCPFVESLSHCSPFWLGCAQNSVALSLIWGEGWKRKTFFEVRLCSVTVRGISYHWKGKFAAATAATKLKTKQKTYISFCINIPKPAKDDFLIIWIIASFHQHRQFRTDCTCRHQLKDNGFWKWITLRKKCFSQELLKMSWL